MNDRNKIIINSSTKNLARVRKFVEERAKRTDADAITINQIVMSVDEACSNVIKYTHRHNDKFKIGVEVFHLEKEFKVIITYTGFEFNPNDIENPDMEEYFAKYKVGGLGIPMMRKFMDKIDYRRYKPNVNSLTLIKSL